jgi:hypothetical protein
MGETASSVAGDDYKNGFAQLGYNVRSVGLHSRSIKTNYQFFDFFKIRLTILGSAST